MSEPNADESAATLPSRMTDVTRIGNRVHRSVTGQGRDVPEYLRRLEDAGFSGAPRWFGLDAEGRGVFEFIEGHVPRAATDVPAGGLASVGVLLRRLHETSRPIVSPPGAPPRRDLVLCHNDLAPRNTVFRDGTAVAFIDWDFASPDDPLWDLSHAVWQFVLAGEGRGELDARRSAARELLHGYEPGFDGWDLLLPTIERRIRSTLDGIVHKAGHGDPAHVALVRQGVVAELDDLLKWLDRNRPSLSRWFDRPSRSR